jgi:hypothetical protein
VIHEKREQEIEALVQLLFLGSFPGVVWAF